MKRKKAVKKQHMMLEEWTRRGLELESQGIEVNVVGRYPKPGFGMPQRSTKKRGS